MKKTNLKLVKARVLIFAQLNSTITSLKEDFFSKTNLEEVFDRDVLFFSFGHNDECVEFPTKTSLRITVPSICPLWVLSQCKNDYFSTTVLHFLSIIISYCGGYTSSSSPVAERSENKTAFP